MEGCLLAKLEGMRKEEVTRVFLGESEKCHGVTEAELLGLQNSEGDVSSGPGQGRLHNRGRGDTDTGVDGHPKPI